MKPNSLRIALLSFMSLVFAGITLAATQGTFSEIKPKSTLTSEKEDASLVLKLIKTSGGPEAHLSFNAKEGNTGTLKIYNSKNQFVHQFEISLVPAPEFSIISLTEYESGSYTFELTTSVGVHVSHLTID